MDNPLLQIFGDFWGPLGGRFWGKIVKISLIDHTLLQGRFFPELTTDLQVSRKIKISKIPLHLLFFLDSETSPAVLAYYSNVIGAFIGETFTLNATTDTKESETQTMSKT